MKLALHLTILLLAHPTLAQPREQQPVKVVAPTAIAIPYPGGQAAFPVYASLAWTRPQPGITRAVIVIHGLNRNADSYFAGALRAQAAAGMNGTTSIMVAPQFLADFDLPANPLPPGTLGWAWNRWARGAPALTPAPISSFTAIDAVIERLANPTLFPDLTTIVLAGFSAGGQVVQRYAVVGQAEPRLRPRLGVTPGVKLEYVVSDPSSYLYFTPDRPAPTASCLTANDWHHGFGAGMPPYVQGTPATLEARYIARHVT